MGQLLCGRTARLLDLLHANRAPGPTSISDSEGGRMETGRDDEGGAGPGHLLHATEMLPHPTLGGDIPGQVAQTGSEQRDRSVEGSGHQTRDADHSKSGINRHRG